ncbi:MAG: hypothetical protein H6542_01905 [Lentimicrobiaceae bacterium]|nr:hypothetical protein [Lentimicrobiaceae bacterium]HPG33015.1 hypothetical protein [Lentimicrobium sp.]
MEKELKNILLQEQSRANTDLVVRIIMAHPALFDTLWSFMFKNEDPLSRRAAWAADYCAEINPEFLINKIGRLSSGLVNFSSDGLKRHALRMISRSDLPKDELGILADTCFNWLQSDNESIAVKVHCMVILKKISDNIPEIRRELYDIIEIQMNEASSGFRNTGKKILKSLIFRN